MINNLQNINPSSMGAGELEAIIVDDEPYCCESLATLMERFCPEVTISAICNSGDQALSAIQKIKPHLVFLDIEMPYMNGFELLEKLPSIDFELVFTTSYDQYAIKAFQFSALDYLLKPIVREELQKAVNKVVRRTQSPLPQQIEILLQKINHTNNSIQRIALPTMEGLQLVPVNSIISCASEGNYTIFLIKDKQKIVVSRPLKEVEEMLAEHSFFRVHHSYIVNMNEIDKFIKTDGGYLIMSDGSSVDVSRSKKDVLLKKLLPYKE
ncbi:MAG TPA: LytTR family DNA-binding domain-containing protein [Chitinophagaceae bacterium]|nr:LytTR family DNA-binding domain-containing protein [Chitinophagaceae bacterium]